MDNIGKMGVFTSWIIVFTMCTSMQLYFTWPFPSELVYFVCMIVCLCYFASKEKVITKTADGKRRVQYKSPFVRFNAGLLALIVVSYLYNLSRNTTFANFPVLFTYICRIVITPCVIFSTISFKRSLFKNLDILLKIVCGISLVGWILYLLGVNLPHYPAEQNNYYIYQAYYLFIKGDKLTDLIPRFCGMFLEPGHAGSTSCLMLYLNRFNLKKKSNYIYLLTIIFSLSLAAYMLLIIGLFLYFFFEGKKIMKKMIGLLAVMSVFVYAGLSFNGGDNVLNEKILSRLEVNEEGQLAGDNRTTGMFNTYYEKWLQEGNLVLGYGNAVYNTRGTNLANGTATYKRFFFINGLLGVFLVLLLYYKLLIRNFSRQGLGFTLLLLVCNMIRDYPYRELWFYVFAAGIALLYYEEKMAKQQRPMPVKKFVQIKTQR